jgi:hypothetical protein
MNSDKNIIWISHRGLSHEYDENTYGAFHAAVKSGFNCLETDLRTTADGHIVLNHDHNLNHVSSVKGKISQMTRTELEKVELHKGSRILFLDKFMSEFDKQNWVFDIKPQTAHETTDKLFELFKPKPKLINKIIFLFWSQSLQDKFLKKYPDAICFAQENECRRAIISHIIKLPFLSGIKRDKIYSIPPKFMGINLICKKKINKYHSLGARTLAYLPKTQEELDDSIQSGVEFILTNHLPVKYVSADILSVQQANRKGKRRKKKTDRIPVN